MRSATMAAVQLTPQDSPAVSWEEVHDTTAREKTVAVTVSAQFGLW